MTPQDEDRDYKARVREVEKVLSLLGLKVVGLEGDTAIAKEGIYDFRAFQREHLQWMGWFKANEENRQKEEIRLAKEREAKDKARARIHYWWLGILSTIIVGAVLGIGSWLFNFLTTHHISDNRPVATTSEVQNAHIPQTR